MAKKHIFEIVAFEKDDPKKKRKIKFSSTDNEVIKLQKSIDNGQKTDIGEIEFNIGSTPEPEEPPTEPDMAPIVNAGDDETVAEGSTVTIDGSAHDNGKIVRFDWQFDPEIKDLVKVDPEDPTNLMFTAPQLLDTEDARGYIFKLEVEDDKSNISRDSCLVTVTQKGEEPPVPEIPPSGKNLYNSNTHGLWNNGVERVVEVSEGNVGPNGLGLYTAASGDPRLKIDGNGVAHLISGSGGVKNLSLKGLSMHQDGGDCSNRGGGEGFSLEKNGYDCKREICHNEHDSIKSGSLPGTIEDYKWYSVEFSWRHEGGKIRLIGKVDFKDGKGLVEVMNVVDESPDAWFNDETRVRKSSYVWIRLNNDDHGRIYIMVINWDAIMTLDFMFEPNENSIALRNVNVDAL
jgi:hypothetical protein